MAFQLYVSNMTGLSYVRLILYRNPPLAELLEGRIHKDLHVQLCASFRWPQLSLLFLYYIIFLSCIKLKFIKIHPCFVRLPSISMCILNSSKMHTAVRACSIVTICFTWQQPMDYWQPSSTFSGFPSASRYLYSGLTPCSHRKESSFCPAEELRVYSDHPLLTVELKPRFLISTFSV